MKLDNKEKVTENALQSKAGAMENTQPRTIDISLWSLIAVNVGTIVFAVMNQWSITQTLLTFWVQSVIIGFFQIIKILTLKNFSVEGLTILGGSAQQNVYTKVRAALFFAVHFGFFHFGYLIFILAVFPYMEGNKVLYEDLPLFFGLYIPKVIPATISLTPVFIAGIAFFINHFISFFEHRSEKENLGRLMSAPYVRIIPMHATLILGGFLFFITRQTIAILVLFLLLKAVLDVSMHIRAHR